MKSDILQLLLFSTLLFCKGQNGMSQYCPVYPYYIVEIKVIDNSLGIIRNLDMYIIDSSKSTLKDRWLEQIEPYFVEQGKWKAIYDDSLLWERKGNGEQYFEGGYACRFALDRHSMADSLRLIIPAQTIEGVSYEAKNMRLKRNECFHLCADLPVSHRGLSDPVTKWIIMKRENELQYYIDLFIPKAMYKLLVYRKMKDETRSLIREIHYDSLNREIIHKSMFGEALYLFKVYDEVNDQLSAVHWANEKRGNYLTYFTKYNERGLPILKHEIKNGEERGAETYFYNDDDELIHEKLLADPGTTDMETYFTYENGNIKTQIRRLGTIYRMGDKISFSVEYFYGNDNEIDSLVFKGNEGQPKSVEIYKRSKNNLLLEIEHYLIEDGNRELNELTKCHFDKEGFEFQRDYFEMENGFLVLLWSTFYEKMEL